MSKIFAFDIDGTLLSSKRKVLPETVDALIKAKEQGHHIVLASGRPYYDMVEVIDAFPEGTIEYVVPNNGSYVMNIVTKEVHMDKTIDPSVLDGVREVAGDEKYAFAIHTIAETRRGRFWDKKEDAPQWYLETDENLGENDVRLFKWDEASKLAKKERIAQISLLSHPEGAARALKLANEMNMEVDMHVAGRIYLDVNPKGANKFVGLQKLASILNIDNENIIGFGDSGNDIQMLDGVGLGIAMENATDEAKQAADRVIGNNDGPSIANAVLEII